MNGNTSLDVRRRRLLLGCAMACWIGPAAADTRAGVPALRRPALMAPQSLRGAMLAVASAGRRLVAVGERGIVLLSDDQGASWHQVATPVSVTLTAVHFANATTGWATGHSGLVLSTTDGGQTWTPRLDGTIAAGLVVAEAGAMAQRLGADDPAARRALAAAARFAADGPDKPLLDLHFSDARHGMVVGAYGLAFSTEDGGATWASALGRLDNPKGLHLNAIGGDGPHLVIAGEQGLLLRSSDGGQSFARLDTPYRGSWFAVHVGAAGQLVLGGLRGNAYFSPDMGMSWSQIALDQQASLTAFAGGGRRLVAVNQAGMLFASDNGGSAFARLPVQGAVSPTGVLEVGDGVFVLAGLRGMQRLEGRGAKS